MFKIGEFAQIAQVNAKLLRHYDSIGLFNPAHIDDENGYRYYSAAQLPTINRIIALKELGFSLADVKDLINRDISADEIRGMLLLRKSQIEQNLRDEATKLKHVQSRLSLVEQHGIIGKDYDIVVKKIEPQRILSWRKMVDNILDAQSSMNKFRQALPSGLPTFTSSKIVALSHTPNEDFNPKQPFDFELGWVLDDVPNNIPSKLDSLNVQFRDLPAIEHAASIIDAGGHERTTNALGIWLENNHFRIAGPWREYYYFELEKSSVTLELIVPVEAISA